MLSVSAHLRLHETCPETVSSILNDAEKYFNLPPPALAAVQAPVSAWHTGGWSQNLCDGETGVGLLGQHLPLADHSEGLDGSWEHLWSSAPCV